ncbi:MAG: LysE family transporter [Vallitaleaceae bacterium]|nr:LysE family transporter [Vallitaleaceae bacterium]
MVIKGFRYGMLLQLAIGPIAIYIFQISVTRGLIEGLAGVIGVVLVDAIFIIFAIFGLGILLKKSNAQIFIKIIGAGILVLFGISIIVSQLGIDLMPSISTSVVMGNAFITAIIMTAANPLTIIFWTGVFSSKVLELEMVKKDMYLFGFGAVLSTLITQSMIAVIGQYTSSLLNDTLMSYMNILVGIILIYFGLSLLLRKSIDTELTSEG